VLVGELVGARLIAHAGSLVNLAKHPASTVQILGAEKALFRALKTKKATPKYGLIYHASLVGQTTPKNKGKISRILANKAALSCRVDALGDENTKPIGLQNLEKITARMQALDGRKAIPITPVQTEKYNKPTVAGPAYIGESEAQMDVAEQNGDSKEENKSKKDKKDKKEKKDKKKEKTFRI